LARQEFERARRYDHPFTLGYFDLDDYEEVADASSRGRGGDAAVGGRVGPPIDPQSDVVARLGGDSFGMLLPEAGPEAADTVIRKLQQTVRDESDATALPLSISGGVVTCLQPAESLEAVISAADRLLTGAKGAGTDTIWCEVIAPQPLEGFEPARMRRPFRLPRDSICRSRRCYAGRGTGDYYSPAILMPSTMNCTAIAHSTSPMSRVRIRMPVWPSRFSTRGAAARVT